MENKDKLIALTNKFLEEFTEISCQDSSMAINYYLPEILCQSNMLQYNEQYSLLLGMSEFDTNFCKERFNQRIQGFISIIEKRITKLDDQEDYYVENVKEKEFEYEDINFEIDNYDNTMFHTTKVKKTGKKITFDVRNSKSGFEGKVEMTKKINLVSCTEEKIVKDWVVDTVKFYVEGESFPVMSIRYRFDFEKNCNVEEGTIGHFKHIADINSFYTTLIF